MITFKTKIRGAEALQDALRAIPGEVQGKVLLASVKPEAQDFATRAMEAAPRTGTT